METKRKDEAIYENVSQRAQGKNGIAEIRTLLLMQENVNQPKKEGQPDLCGMRFGNLNVMERLSEYHFLCRCDCGNEIALLASVLVTGKRTSCGCMRGKRRRKDITGLRSGRLVAVEATTEKRKGNILWRCRCDCGNELLTEAYKIRNSLIQSCGCSRKGKGMKELTGQRFGKLVALERLKEKRGSSYLWLCQCDCGRQSRVSTNALLKGSTRSCGCTVSENASARVRNGGSIQDLCHYVDGTCIESLKNGKKVRTDNTSGYTGVQSRRGKWVALITFKKKVYYLGSYDRIEDAVRARKQAEDRIFGNFLDWYEKSFSDQQQAE